MPREPFKKAEGGVVATVTETGAKVSPEVASVRDKETFAQEMHFQVYRIENVLKITSPDALKGIAQTNPDLMKQQPALMMFFDAYSGNRTNEFIEQAKTKSGDEREKLLDGIRKLIFKASLAKKEAERGATEENKKQAEEQDKEVLKAQEMLTKELTMEDIADIESDLAMPFNTGKSTMDLNKIQHYYMKIIAGQRAFGTHMQEMQENYGAAIKKFESFNKKYTSGILHGGLGIVPWAGRKISSGWGQVKRFGNWVRGKKHTPDKSDSEKVNEAIAAAREQFQGKMDRLKSTKTKIDARAAELKKGLIDSKSDIRARLKHLISSEDWTKAKLSEKEKQKVLLEAQKKQLSDSLSGVQEKGREIDAARGKASTLKGTLAEKYKTITVGETSLNDRIASVKERISQLETTYGKDDPRVLHVRQKVLVPLLQGQDRMAQIKEGTAGQLNNVEADNQKLDLLKADVFVGETATISQLSKTELEISTAGKEIDVITAKRTELHELLGGMETAYMAVDEFKSSVDTNLDKMLKDNTEAVKAVDQQNDVLKNIKASEPGVFKSLYNTVGIGHYGIVGGVEVAFQHSTRTIGYLGRNFYNVATGKGWSFEYSKTKTWHVGTAASWVYEKYDKWVYKNLKKFDNDTPWWAGVLTKPLLLSGAALKAGVGLVNGVAILASTPKAVLESLDNIFSSWSEAKKMLKGMVHWDEWGSSKTGAFGQCAGDIIIMVLTGGASGAAVAGKGAAAAKVAVAMGNGAKGAYLVAASKEVLRQAVNMPINLVKGVGGALKALGSGIKGGWKGLGIIASGLKGGEVMSGLRSLSIDRVGLKVADIGADISKHVDNLLAKGVQFSSETKGLLDKIKKSGVHNLNQAELGALRLGLADDLAKISGWGVSNVVDKLGRSVGQYSRASLKLTELNVKAAANTAKFSPQAAMESAYRVLNGTPKGFIEIFKGKAALEKAMKYLYEAKDGVMTTAMSDKFKLIQEQIIKLKGDFKIARGSARRKMGNELSNLHVSLENIKQAAIKNKESAFTAFKDKYAQLKYFEGVGAKYTAVKTTLDGYWNSLKTINIKNIKPLEIGKVVGYEILKLATCPVWLPIKYAKFLLEMNPIKAKTILEGAGIKFGQGIDNVASFAAIGEISKKINSAILRGNIKEAGYLYYGSRSLAKQAGIPLSAFDTSFLGYIHRVAPITVKKINDVMQLQDINVIDKLPEKVEIDKEAVKKYEEQSAAALAGLIKAKPAQVQKPISKSK